MQVPNVHGAVACGEMCMEQLHVVKCVWSSTVACAEMCMEQLHVVKCVWSSTVACAEMCMEQLHVHVHVIRM